MNHNDEITALLSGENMGKDVASAEGQTPKAADGFMSPSPRPWVLNYTPHADRMQLFCTKQGHALHIGTLVSGSKSKIPIFEANAKFVARACNAHDDLLARVLRLEKALREIQLDAAGILDPENKPGYELREYAEQIHAMAASALSSGAPARNDHSKAESHP